MNAAPTSTATRACAVSRDGTLRAWTLPLLLLLPALCLAWPGPGAPLRNDPYPHLAGTGVVALALLPAMLAVLTGWRSGFSRGASRWVLGLLLVLLAWAALGSGVFVPSDPFEARRALVHWAAACVLFATGTRLGERGLARFLGGTVIVTLMLTAPAVLYALLRDDARELAGLAGDTGSLSQAALPGALVGALLFTRGVCASGSKPWAAVGLGGFALFAWHAGSAPVFAGLLALLGALGATVLLARHAGRPTRLALTFAGASAAVLFLALRGLDAGSAPQAPSPDLATALATADTDPPPDNLSGVGVRLGVWRRVPSMAFDNPLFGVGAGQFQARFPPYRDPLEHQASRGGICGETTPEVEHAHHDALEVLAELGLPGGMLWVAFLLMVGRASLGALRGTSFVGQAAGAAACGLLLNGLAHAPLTFNPGAMALGFPLFGALVAIRAARGASSGPRSRFLFPLVPVIAVAAAVFGLRLVAHGSALRGVIQAVERIAPGGVRPGEAAERGRVTAGPEDTAALLSAVDALVRSAPESAPARLLRASYGIDPDPVAPWERVLEVRPASVGALDRLGLVHANAGRTADARSRWTAALALAPTHPRLLRNLTRLELLEGDPEQGLAYLARLDANGCPSPKWRRALGLRLALEGRPSTASTLLDVEVEAGEALHAMSDAAEGSDRHAFNALAQIAWARQHAAREDYAAAVRNYRQALKSSRAGPFAEGAPLVRAELAAALFRAGRAEEASELLRDFALPEAHRREMQPWAREVLDAARSEGPGLDTDGRG